MPGFEQKDQFFSRTQQLFKYLVETRIKIFKAAENNNNFVETKEYNQSKVKSTAKYADRYYDLKKQVSPRESQIPTEKKNEKIERRSLDIDFNEENILQAVVYSEIFGKPKAKTRRR